MLVCLYVVVGNHQFTGSKSLFLAVLSPEVVQKTRYTDTYIHTHTCAHSHSHTHTHTHTHTHIYTHTQQNIHVWFNNNVRLWEEREELLLLKFV